MPKLLDTVYNSVPITDYPNIVQIYYDDVGRWQLDLSDEEEEALCRRLARNRNRLKSRIGRLSGIAYVFRAEWRKLYDANKSTASLAQDFNSTKLGYNELTKVRVDASMRAEPPCVEAANFSNEFYVQVYNVWLNGRAPRQTITALIDDNTEIEHRLIRSVLKMARQVANKYGGVFGIEKADAIQEANRALVLAVKMFDPTTTVGGKRVKFRTYAHFRCEGLVKEWIMSTSRLVGLPKGRLRKMFIVIEASKRLGDERYDIDAVTEMANSILERRSKLGERVSENDVQEALKLLRNGSTLPLDMPAKDSDEGERQTFADTWPDVTSPNPEDEATRNLAAEKLLKAVDEYLTPLQAELIKRRYLWHIVNPDLPHTVRPFNVVIPELGHLLTPTRKGVSSNGGLRSNEWGRQLEVEALKILKAKCPNLEEMLTYCIFEEATNDDAN